MINEILCPKCNNTLYKIHDNRMCGGYYYFCINNHKLDKNLQKIKKHK